MLNIKFRHCITSVILLITSFFAYGKSQEMKDTMMLMQLLERAKSYQNSHTDSCYLISMEVLHMAQKISFPTGIRGACIRLGSVKLIKGDNDSALYYADMALGISQTLNDHKLMAACQMLRSYVYQNMGLHDSSFSCLYQGLRSATIASDLTLQIQLRNTMADLYFLYGDYRQAMISYMLALSMNRQNEDPFLSSAAMMGIGNVYYKQDSWRLALSWYQRADSVYMATGDSKGHAQNLNNIALCYSGLKEYRKALLLYHEALNAYQQMGLQTEEANLYFNAALLFLEMKQPDSAIVFLDAGHKLSRKINDLHTSASCLQSLAVAWSQKGAFDKAYHFQVAYTALMDSMLNSEKISSISEMQTRFETSKKEQEIALLNEQNKVRSGQRNFLIAGSVGLLVFLTVVMRQRNKVSKERKRSDKLLLEILPAEVADELKQTGQAKPRYFENVSVLFTDFENFTGISAQMSPTEIVVEIHKNFTAFDHITSRHGLEKIKTIGDAYMAVCGLPAEREDHAIRMVKAAQEMLAFANESNSRFKVRIGIHCGPVVAGIVGVKKYAYDVWGDTVNTAARMEQNSESGRINVSGAIYELTKKEFNYTYRGKIKVKNKGEIDMYFLEG